MLKYTLHFLSYAKYIRLKTIPHCRRELPPPAKMIAIPYLTTLTAYFSYGLLFAFGQFRDFFWKIIDWCSSNNLQVPSILTFFFGQFLLFMHLDWTEYVCSSCSFNSDIFFSIFSFSIFIVYVIRLNWISVFFNSKILYVLLYIPCIGCHVDVTMRINMFRFWWEKVHRDDVFVLV